MAAGSGKGFYGTYDHLGTPRLITDTAGATLDLVKYWPYGEEASASPTTPQRLRFAGMERDTEGKRYYAHARSFDFQAAGRFLSVDLLTGRPDNPQSFNRYAYVLGNPLTLVDPTGLTEECPDIKQCVQTGSFEDGKFVPSGNITALSFAEDVEEAEIQQYLTSREEFGDKAQAEFDELAQEGKEAAKEYGPYIIPVGGPLRFLGRLGKVGGRVAAFARIAFGRVPKGSLKHMSKHLPAFKALDAAFGRVDQVALGYEISRPANLVGTPGGRKVFEEVVEIGGQNVRVRAVWNPEGGLRSVHIRGK